MVAIWDQDTDSRDDYMAGVGERGIRDNNKYSVALVDKSRSSRFSF